MVKVGRKEEFIDTTMQIVAQNGLGGFAMKQVTSKMGVSEALIYKYFETKENLLYACFESFHMRVAALFRNFTLPPITSPQDMYAAIRSLWFTYFEFLVNGDYRTIYYFDYRDSPYIREVMKHDDEAAATYFKYFAAIVHNINTRARFTERSSGAHLWMYVLDTSGIFAKRIIRGELPRTEESYEEIWRLISQGILGVVMPTPTGLGNS